MGRARWVVVLMISSTLGIGVNGCGGSIRKSSPTIPGSIRLSPSIGSLDLGSTLAFLVLINGAFTSAVPVTYSSTNPAVLTVANNGLACAGTWDNPVTPVVCTPKGAGVALVTASSNGITSAPVTVYVHQHIDQITASPVSPPPGCYSATTVSQAAASQTYQARALSNGVDITSTVGPFNWSTANPQVATITPLSTNQIPNGQAQATAKIPGMTEIFASIANTTSAPMNFSTCAVESIVLGISTSGSTSFVGAKGNFTINSTVTDINGNSIIGVPLIWSSTEPAVASVPASGMSATVSGAGIGGATITASCAPPGCNIGFTPMQAVYSTTPVSVTFTGTPAAATAFVTSTGCANTTESCATSLLSISSSSPSLTNVTTNLNPPNSLRFSAGGTNAYMGSRKGLLSFTPGGSSPLSLVSNSVTGKVLAVSSDGKKIVVAGCGTTSPCIEQVWLVDTTTASSPLINDFLISGATAAAFSPDNLKAYILAGSTLYVYSSQQALQSIPLSAPATDVAFLGNGTFGYIAQGSSVSYLPVCDGFEPPLPLPSTSVAGALLRQVNDTQAQNTLLALAPPSLSVINAMVTGIPTATNPCSVTVNNSLGPVINLGQGVFTPVAFLVSSNGQKAYIAASNLGSVLVVDIPNSTTSSIPLVGSPTPLAADLSVDGQTLFVSASDAKVHVINMVSGGDTAQVPVPSSSLCSVTSGTAPACLPDLLAVRP